MYAHEVDELGYPIDPGLRELEENLCALAGAWAGSYGNPSRQEEIVHEYHTTMSQLYSLGWDGTLDLECKLPSELMPKEYLRRHPKPSFDIWQWPRKSKE
jgi:hypothetical protein